MEKIIRETGMSHETFRDGVNFDRFTMGVKDIIISKRVVEEIENEMSIPMQEWIDEIQPLSSTELVKEINEHIEVEIVI